MCMIAYHWNPMWDYRCWKILCTCPSCICRSKSLTLSSTCWICRTYKEIIMMKYSSHRHHTRTTEAKHGYTSIIRHLWIPHTSRITSKQKDTQTERSCWIFMNKVYNNIKCIKWMFKAPMNHICWPKKEKKKELHNKTNNNIRVHWTQK